MKIQKEPLINLSKKEDSKSADEKPEESEKAKKEPEEEESDAKKSDNV